MDIDTLIKKIQTGDTESYGIVVREFQGRIRAFAASYCPDRNLVDDIAQRTFVWAFEHLSNYEIDTHFYRWLKSIARNVLLSELESIKREAKNRHNYLALMQASASHRNLQVSTDREPEMMDALRRCLDRLPEKSRALIQRRYGTSEFLADIARYQGQTEGVVKMTLFRIRQTLRACVESVILEAGNQ